MQIRDQRKPGWLWADRDIVKRDGATLGPYAIAVYVALCSFAGEDQTAWPKQKTLAEITGMSRSQVRRSVGKLSKAGWIEVTPRRTPEGDRASHLYTLLPTPTRGCVPQEQPHKGVVPTRHNGCSHQTQPLCPPEPRSKAIERKPLNDNTTSSDKPTAKPHPIKELLRRCEKVWGYATPNGGKEAKAGKALQKRHSDDEIIACLSWVMQDPFYRDKHVTLWAVNEKMGPWIKLGRPTVYRGGNSNGRTTQRRGASRRAVSAPGKAGGDELSDWERQYRDHVAKVTSG